MKGRDKTKEQLINELAELHQRTPELEALETKHKRIEKALLASAQQWQRTFDAVGDVVCLQSVEGRILRCNTAMANLLGKPFDEIKGRTCWELMHGTSEPIEGCPIVRMRETHHRETFILPRGDRWLEDSVDPLLDENDNLIGAVHIISDVTERKQAEEALRESQERYRALVNLGGAVGEAIVMLQDTEQGDAIHAFVNREWPRITGYSRKELLGISFFDLLHPRYHQAALKRHKRRMRGEVIPELFELSIIRKDGTEVPIEATSAYSTYKGKRANVAFIRDITERKQTEKALRESEERIQTIVSNAPVVIWSLDKEGIFTLSEGAGLKALGLRPGEVVGQSIFDVYHNVPKILEANRRALAGETFVSIIEVGELVFESHYSPIRDKSGEVAGMVGVSTDITERKRVEEALLESAQKYRALFETILDGAFVIDAETMKTVFANQAAAKMFGFDSVEDAVGVNPVDLVPPNDRERVVRIIAEDMFEKNLRQVNEFRVMTKDGRELWISAIGVRTEYQGRLAGLISFRDITERKQAEEALQESEERYRALVNLGGKIGEAIVMLQDTEQGDAIHAFVSAEWPHITGYSRKELLGISFFDLLHPKHRQASLKRHKRKVSGEVIPELFEMSIIRKDGTEVPIELTSAYTTYKGERANVAFIRDITERKQAEERERRLQQELYLSSRLASIGKLAAGVAHQINNPLTGILGFSERLLRKSTDKEVTRDLERIHNEAARTAQIIQSLLTFARRHKPKKEYADINDILQKALELRAYELKTGNIEVALDLAPDLPQAIADFNQIEEVFLNLILNAEQTMIETHHRGKLIIKTQQTKDYIKISFADDGPGIPAEHLDRLFDPFFTTREDKGGTGLGLSVCHGIVTEHEGKIYAKSKSGKGSTFFVELPVTTAKIDESK